MHLFILIFLWLVQNSQIMVEKESFSVVNASLAGPKKRVNAGLAVSSLSQLICLNLLFTSLLSK